MIMSIISDIRAYTGFMTAEPTFGEWLEDRLLAAGYTQTDLAEELGISQSTVSNWVNDVSPPNRANCYKLADIFSIPRREVALRAGHKPKQSDLIPSVNSKMRTTGSSSVTVNGIVVEPEPQVKEIGESLRDPRIRLFLRRAGELTDEQWNELIRILESDD